MTAMKESTGYLMKASRKELVKQKPAPPTPIVRTITVETGALPVLVSGEGKREVLDKILSGDTDLPAAHIRAEGEVIWFVDRAAAGRWA